MSFAELKATSPWSGEGGSGSTAAFASDAAQARSVRGRPSVLSPVVEQEIPAGNDHLGSHEMGLAF